jgi:hypothetical protein
VLRGILLIVASLLSPESKLTIEDRCDYIEFNSFDSSGNGNYYSQIIFWEWRDSGVANTQKDLAGRKTGLITYSGGFSVVDWRMLKSERSPNAVSVTVLRYHGAPGLIGVIFWDSKDKIFRKVVAKRIIHSKGNDREQENAGLFPSKSRRGLSGPK